MLLLATKTLLTPILLALCTAASHHWGNAVGGWLLGLPLASGPLSLFLALQHGGRFAASAARSSLLGFLAVGVFCLVYLALAKSRIGPPYAQQRQALALAFAQDTVDAALEAAQVKVVVVVTDDELVTQVCRAAGAQVVPDAPDSGLNAALRHGAEHVRAAHPASGLAALSGDLPALRPAELDAALTAARELPTALVCDVTGVGTTLLTASQGTDLVPEFGPRSRAAHRARGAVELDGAWPSLRRDVDTVVDLLDARRLGLGPATAKVLADLESS